MSDPHPPAHQTILSLSLPRLNISQGDPIQTVVLKEPNSTTINHKPSSPLVINQSQDIAECRLAEEDHSEDFTSFSSYSEIPKSCTAVSSFSSNPDALSAGLELRCPLAAVSESDPPARAPTSAACARDRNTDLVGADKMRDAARRILSLTDRFAAQREDLSRSFSELDGDALAAHGGQEPFARYACLARASAPAASLSGRDGTPLPPECDRTAK